MTHPANVLPFTLVTILTSCLIISASEDVVDPDYEKQILAARWDFHEYTIHITVMVFLLCVILIKMIFHRIPYVSQYLPESLLLIIIGVLFGAVIRFGFQNGKYVASQWNLTPTLFFDYLLPPIILESAYSLYNRTFSEYLGVVLIFAVLATILNFLMIGFCMYGLYIAGAFGPTKLVVDLKGMLLFSSLIVAVDPVAVLAIFQDIGIELGLYYIVFGESLLNDAITVVLYEIMSAFAGKDVVSGHEIGVGIASFFTVSLGGLLIGVVVGVISCLITRFQSRLNAFTLLLLAYFSYIMADCVGWSGIISMIGCGLIQAAYAFNNLDKASVTLVHQFTKLVAEVSEAVIFLFLGLEVLTGNLKWDTGFILWGLVLCLVARAVVVFPLTAIVNYLRIGGTRISFRNQIILIYGGLRGAVAFSLAVLIKPTETDFHGKYSRDVTITATLFIILFTVGIMGTTIKPLVKVLKIGMQSKKTLSVFLTLNDHVIDDTMAGIEILLGFKGRNVVRELFIKIDEKYLRKILQREPENRDQKVMKTYEKMALKLHEAAMHPENMDNILANLPGNVKELHTVPIAGEDSRLGSHETIARSTESIFPLRSTRSVQFTADGQRLSFENTIENAVTHRTMAYRRISQLPLDADNQIPYTGTTSLNDETFETNASEEHGDQLSRIYP